MSFVANDAGFEQLSLFDSFNTLTDREKGFWTNPGRNIFRKNLP